ncbi:hypothetical protein BTVI_17114 [Pitangus sulphuratus]|nr:hypothetical protein BTVI_17114 [Pitangus sulphuratus]
MDTTGDLKLSQMYGYGISPRYLADERSALADSSHTVNSLLKQQSYPLSKRYKLIRNSNMIYALHQGTGTNIGIKVTYLTVKSTVKRSQKGSPDISSVFCHKQRAKHLFSTRSDAVFSAEGTRGGDRPRAASSAMHLQFKMVDTGQGGKDSNQDFYGSNRDFYDSFDEQLKLKFTAAGQM